MSTPLTQKLSSLDAFLLRTGSGMLSGRGRNASLLVMIFHRVLPQPDPMMPDEPDAASFAAQMDLVAENFNVLPLREAITRLRDGSLPPRALCITFDDGYANNYEVALPILAARKLPATVFVAAGFLNGGRMFNDTVIETVRGAGVVIDLEAEGIGKFDLTKPGARRAAQREIVTKLKYLSPPDRMREAEALAARLGVKLPSNLMMTDDQVRKLAAAGVEIGAHTMTHPILTRIDADTARREITESKRRLEEILGMPVRSFAYPNGRPGQDYDGTHVKIAKEAGFDLAVSTAWGAATSGSDNFQIPRVAPWDASARRYGMRLMKAYRQRQFQTATC